MDRRLIVSVLSAVAALTAGVLAVVLAAPALGLVAGCLGLGAGIGAAAIATVLRERDEDATERAAEIRILRAEIDALSAVMGEPALREAEVVSEEQALTRSRARHPSNGSADPARDPVVRQAAPRRRDVVAPDHLATMLHQRVAAARRQLHPVSVVILALESEDGAGGAIDELADLVLDTLRECDTVVRANDLTLTAVLDGASEHGAVWAVERVRRARAEASVTGSPAELYAGIACYPSHALEAIDLVDAAGRALEAARGRGGSGIQVAERDLT